MLTHIHTYSTHWDTHIQTRHTLSPLCLRCPLPSLLKPLSLYSSLSSRLPVTPPCPPACFIVNIQFLSRLLHSTFLSSPSSHLPYQHPSLLSSLHSLSHFFCHSLTPHSFSLADPQHILIAEAPSADQQLWTPEMYSAEYCRVLVYTRRRHLAFSANILLS